MIDIPAMDLHEMEMQLRINDLVEALVRDRDSLTINHDRLRELDVMKRPLVIRNGPH